MLSPGSIAIALGQTIDDLKKQLATNPQSVALLCQLADVYTRTYLETERVEEQWLTLALKAALDARKVDKASALPHLSLARAFLAQEKLVDALERAKRALELDPKNQAGEVLLREIESKLGPAKATAPRLDPKAVAAALPDQTEPAEKLEEQKAQAKTASEQGTVSGKTTVETGPAIFAPAPADPATREFRDAELSSAGDEGGRVELPGVAGQQVTWPDGSKYAGGIVNGKFHGVGAYTWPNGDHYIGAWIDGKMSGRGTFVWADGARYVGEWRNDRRDGRGTLLSPKGDRYSGEWKDGNEEGFGLRVGANGDSYLGEWRNNLRHGYGSFAWPDRTRYLGHFQDDQPSGGWIILRDGTVTWSRLDPKREWINLPTAPANLISFNNTRWNDLSPTFAAEGPVYFWTDNKGAGEAALVLWAAYPRAQEFFVNGYRDTRKEKDSESNQGKRAWLRVERVAPPPSAQPTSDSIRARLAREGVPENFLGPLLKGYLYRIEIRAPDDGYYASYILGAASRATAAIGRAVIDDEGREEFRAQAGTLAGVSPNN